MSDPSGPPNQPPPPPEVAVPGPYASPPPPPAGYAAPPPYQQPGTPPPVLPPRASRLASTNGSTVWSPRRINTGRPGIDSVVHPLEASAHVNAAPASPTPSVRTWSGASCRPAAEASDWPSRSA